MTEWTPGPWSTSEPPYDSIPWHHLYGSDGKHIMHRERSDEEKIASVKLMSAAPDLYAALESAEDAIAEHLPGLEYLLDNVISPALAKARGETQ